MTHWWFDIVQRSHMFPHLETVIAYWLTLNKPGTVLLVRTFLWTRWWIYNWPMNIKVCFLEDFVNEPSFFQHVSLTHTKLSISCKAQGRIQQTAVSVCLLAPVAKRCKNSQRHASLWSLNNTSVCSLSYNVRPLTRFWKTHTRTNQICLLKMNKVSLELCM